MTRLEAIDSILAVFKTAWDTTGFGSRVAYEGVANKNVRPSGVETWARVSLRHVTSGQTTIGGAQGTRRFQRNGVLVVQVFEAAGKGLSGSTDLATIVKDAFEGKSSPEGVLFRNATINEVGLDADFYQTNVVVSFEYDEIK